MLSVTQVSRLVDDNHESSGSASSTAIPHSADRLTTSSEWFAVGGGGHDYVEENTNNAYAKYVPIT